jgi:hypothetical protein
MRRKNYIGIALDPIFSDPNYNVEQIINVPPTDSSNTNTAGGTADDKKNKGDFWKNLANIAGGLFSNKNNQPQQTYVPQEAPKDKPNYGLIIGIIVAAIVVGVAIYFMTRK